MKGAERLAVKPGFDALASFNLAICASLSRTSAAAILVLSCATVHAPIRVDPTPGRAMAQASATVAARITVGVEDGPRCRFVSAPIHLGQRLFCQGKAG